MFSVFSSLSRSFSLFLVFLVSQGFKRRDAQSFFNKVQVVYLSLNWFTNEWANHMKALHRVHRAIDNIYKLIKSSVDRNTSWSSRVTYRFFISHIKDRRVSVIFHPVVTGFIQ